MLAELYQQCARVGAACVVGASLAGCSLYDDRKLQNDFLITGDASKFGESRAVFKPGDVTLTYGVGLASYVFDAPMSSTRAEIAPRVFVTLKFY